jgi:hypothetical protein
MLLVRPSVHLLPIEACVIKSKTKCQDVFSFSLSERNIFKSSSSALIAASPNSLSLEKI